VSGENMTDPDVYALNEAKQALMKSQDKVALLAALDYLIDFFVIHPNEKVTEKFYPQDNPVT
jgi:hypothetical protein